MTSRGSRTAGRYRLEHTQSIVSRAEPGVIEIDRPTSGEPIFRRRGHHTYHRRALAVYTYYVNTI